MLVVEMIDSLSIDIMPSYNDSLSTLTTKFILMLLIIVIIMICYSYSYYQIGQVVSIGGIVILIMYLFSNKKEMFSQLTNKMDQVTPISIDSPPPTSPIDYDQMQSSQQSQYPPQQSQYPPQQSSQFPPQQSSQYPQTSSFSSGFSSQTNQSQPINYFTPTLGQNQEIYRQPVRIAPRIMDPQFSSVQTNFPVDRNPVQELGGMAMPVYEKQRVRRPGLLMERTSTESEVSHEHLRPYRMFMQDVEPNVYSFTNERTPINSNLGISSTPQMPPLRKEVFRGEDGRSYPLYSRIDPQLVRNDVPEGRLEEMPRRNEWSQDLPGAAPSNSIYSIYDPRFTGYGDSNRSYYDTNLGQIKYYYSDVDAYRSPNFIIRNKVDHVDMIDPMDRVYSEYPRTASLEDVNDTVHDDWMSKSTEFREDIMEKLMRRNNSQSWQLRMAPHSKGSHLSTFSSRY